MEINADENYNKCKGNAYRYEASDSLLRYPKGTDGAEEMFLIVDSWDFIMEFNSWAKDKYGKESCMTKRDMICLKMKKIENILQHG